MFESTKSFNQDINNWNVSKDQKNIKRMFHNN